MTKDIKFLKKHSRDFWDNALTLFSQGKYNLAAFNLEQSCQLYLKYLIAKEVGNWPKSHNLYELTKKLSEVYENEKILKFYEENELFFDDLNDAYFTTRYFPKNFSQNLTTRLIDNLKKFFNFLEEELKEKFFNGSNYN